MNELVLIDTSAWISFFRKKNGGSGTADEVTRLLSGGAVCTSQPVFMELVACARSTAGLKVLTRNFAGLPMLSIGEREWDRVRDIAIALRMKDNRVGVIDMLLAATAINNDIRLLHHDKHFCSISSVAPLREYGMSAD